MGPQEKGSPSVKWQGPQKLPPARHMDLDTSCLVPFCKFSVPHNFPAQKFLLGGAGVAHCTALPHGNEGAGRNQIVCRSPEPALSRALLCVTV